LRPERAAHWLANLGAMLLLFLILMRGFSLITTKLAVAGEAAAAAEAQSTPAEDAAPPVLGNYVFPPDGRSVFFQQEGPDGLSKWYQVDVQGGQPTEGDPPQAALPSFVLTEGELKVRSRQNGDLMTVSPDGMHVIAIAPSPDGQSVAFAGARQNQGSVGLYVLALSGGLNWLGSAEDIRDLSWTPDNEWVLYISPLAGVDQVFRARRDGSELKQLTDDFGDKTGLVVSPDGKQMAYLSTLNDHPNPGTVARFLTGQLPTPDQTREATAIWSDIDVIDQNGKTVRHLTSSDLGRAGLHWVNDGREVAYVRSAMTAPRTAFLYAYNVESGAERRIYPSVAIEGLECPASIPRGGQGSVKLTVSSTALIPSSVPVVLRSGSGPFAPGQVAGSDERRKSAVRVETVDVPPGQTTTVEWPVKAVSGVTAYFSTLVDADSAQFFSEAHCSTKITYMGLRSLPFLPLTLPLLLPGLVLMIPWLRHQKKAWLWGIWLLTPLAVVGMVVWELSMVGF
jgi:hypothetical protein